MAMFSKLLLATTLLSSLALAVPIKERAIVTDWVTKTEWEIIDATTTVYIDDSQTSGGAFIMESALAASYFSQPASSVPSTSTAVPTTPAPSPAASVAPAPAPAPTSYNAPTTLIPVTTPAAASSTAPAPAPPPPATTPAAASSTMNYGAPASSIAAASTHAPGLANAVVASSGSGPASASKTATCEGEGNACVGDITHWDGGMGACGTVVDTNVDFAIAMPYQLMGIQSNGNPYCGRSLTVYNPTSGVSVQATVHDKCMGCLDRAIDLTNVLFTAVAPDGNGRVTGIDWWFND